MYSYHTFLTILIYRKCRIVRIKRLRYTISIISLQKEELVNSREGNSIIDEEVC